MKSSSVAWVHVHKRATCVYQHRFFGRLLYFLINFDSLQSFLSFHPFFLSIISITLNYFVYLRLIVTHESKEQRKQWMDPLL